MKQILPMVVTAVLCLSATSVLAGDAGAGKGKSVTSSGCHGANGIMWPSLAGQKEGYLVAQITAFRDGGRSNPMMTPMAASLSDEDIANLAAYYSSIGQ